MTDTDARATSDGSGLDEALVIGVDDSRRVMAYLLAAESDDYIAVMEVLESSVTDLSPAEVARALLLAGTPLDSHVVDARLEKLRHWGAATARHDTSNIQRYTDLLARNWRAEFEAQYRRGRQFSMVLHPRHIGWAQRLELLDRFLAHMRGFPGVWVATGAECARHWRTTFPAETHLRLEPSIWKDYPGSLS